MGIIIIIIIILGVVVVVVEMHSVVLLRKLKLYCVWITISLIYEYILKILIILILI